MRISRRSVRSSRYFNYSKIRQYLTNVNLGYRHLSPNHSSVRPIPEPDATTGSTDIKDDLRLLSSCYRNISRWTERIHRLSSETFPRIVEHFHRRLVISTFGLGIELTIYGPGNDELEAGWLCRQHMMDVDLDLRRVTC